MEHNCNKQPYTVNIFWKANQESIINLAFGALITAHNWNDETTLCRIWQENDRYLLPQDQYGNVILKLEDWNCLKINAWTYLYWWKPDLQIKS
jgi:hypothetical protein